MLCPSNVAADALDHSASDSVKNRASGVEIPVPCVQTF
jgi:hypothetical protein